MKKQGLKRDSKQCREKWLRSLKPGIKKSDWAQEEDIHIVETVLSQGKKWVSISRHLPNRSEGHIKNRYISLINEERKKYYNELSSGLNSSSSTTCDFSYKTFQEEEIFLLRRVQEKLGKRKDVLSFEFKDKIAHDQSAYLGQPLQNSLGYLDYFQPVPMIVYVPMYNLQYPNTPQKL